MNFDPHAYIDPAAAAVQLEVPAEARKAVAANLARLHALAEEVMSFDINHTPEPEQPRDA